MNPLGLEWNEEEFISVLDSVMQHVEFLQNNPPNLIPKEDLAADAIINFLKPYESVIKVTKYTYVPGRSNLVLEYPINCSENSKVISFVGSHFDVVPANPDEWDFNPFKLSREGDFLRGRGVTDCLGHVALIACLFRALAVSKPKLDIAVKAVFIASEENNEIPHVGIEEMELQGDLRKLSLQNGPLIWVDSANFGPTLGCAGTQTWQMKFLGKAFHSGLPHKAINPIDLASEVMRIVTQKFHEEYKPTDNELKYKFVIGSSMKATQIEVPPGGLNQIPGSCTVRGDIRLTPFFDFEKVKQFVEKVVSEIDVSSISSPGYSKFSLPEEDLIGKIELTWIGETWNGVAVDMESKGYKALKEAVELHHGKGSEFAITGSLPLIGDLKKAGYDVQICGFGRMDAYHAKNEYGVLSEFHKGFKILSSVIEQLSSSN